MFKNKRGKRCVRERAWPSALGLACLSILSALHEAHAVDLQEDAVPGTCSALVAHAAAPGVKGFDGKTFAGNWGVTQPILFAGTQRADGPDAIKDLTLEINPVKAGSEAPMICVEAAKLSPALRAEIHVSAIEWMHKRRPDSECAKEWQRLRNAIRVHENKHVSDIEASLRDTNARVLKRLPIRACAATIVEARVQASLAVLAMIGQELVVLQKSLAEKAAKLDVEKSGMNCKLCNDKISFKDVTLDCVMPTPHCSFRIGQQIEGQVCGDPVKSRWKITPKYFAEGCGVPPSDGKGDKPFTIDCVEAGSDFEKRYVEAHRKSLGGAGGWMCVYREGPTPQITIRNFRMSMCKGAAEQTITVYAEASEGCDEPSQPPPKAPPSKPLPIS